MGTVVAFLSPKENEEDLQENVNIIAQDLSTKPMDLKEFKELSMNQLKQLLTDFKLISSNDVTLNGNSATDLTYTGKQGEYNIKFRQIFTIKDKKAYIITFTSAEEHYNEFDKTIETMINSFEIKK